MNWTTVDQIGVDDDNFYVIPIYVDGVQYRII